MVTLADLSGLPLPKQALGGESLRPLLLTAEGLEVEVSCHSLIVQKDYQMTLSEKSQSGIAMQLSTIF
jgi:hypothetical protein